MIFEFETSFSFLLRFQIDRRKIRHWLINRRFTFLDIFRRMNRFIRWNLFDQIFENFLDIGRCFRRCFNVNDIQRISKFLYEKEFENLLLDFCLLMKIKLELLLVSLVFSFLNQIYFQRESFSDLFRLFHRCPSTIRSDVETIPKVSIETIV